MLPFQIYRDDTAMDSMAATSEKPDARLEARDHGGISALVPGVGYLIVELLHANRGR
jgi:hypothetical protein